MKMQNTTVTRSFKDNLKNIILHESFIRALGLEIIGILLVVCMGLLWGIYKNHTVNSNVKTTLNKAISSYDKFLLSLEETENILLADVSTVWQHTILTNLYKVYFETGLTADIYMLDGNKNVYVGNVTPISEEENNIISRQWNIVELTETHPDKLNIYISKGKEKAVFLGRAVKDRGGRTAYAILRINANRFNSLFSSDRVRVALTQKDYWAIMPEIYRLTDNIGKLNEDFRDRQGLRLIENGFYYVYNERLDYEGFSIYTISDYTVAAKVIISILISSVLVFIIIFTFGSVGIDRAARKSTKDISLLNDAFLSVSSGDLDTNLEIHSSIEFENIGKCFNEMLCNLKRHMKMNKELAEEVAYEQVKQLASQFKSHFLFNTLDNIRHICRISPEITEHMVLALSEILRYNASNQNEKVSIKEDLKYIKRYLEIMSIRYGEDVFTYDIDIAKEASECQVLKLLIQPLVENAVKYGFADNESLHISIKTEKKGNDIYLSCEDNGQGMKKETLDNIIENLSNTENKTPHLGLYNVHRRVYLTYGQGYGLILKNISGLKASIKIPFEMESENE